MIFRDKHGKALPVRYINATPEEARVLACAFTESSQSVPYKAICVGSLCACLVTDHPAPAKPPHVPVDEVTP
jgi:hypothetical protein